MEFSNITPIAGPRTSASPTPVDPAAREAAREFEAMMLGQMVDSMMATVKTGTFGGGHAEETWRSFLSDAIGAEMARGDGTGIAAQIEGAIARYRQGGAT